MAFVMNGIFNKYGGWQMVLIETCQKFFEKYNRYPNFIRMNEKTMDALFDENEKAFLDPYSEEHAVRDSNGEILIPLNVTDENNYEGPENLHEKHKEFIDDYVETHSPDEVYESWMNYDDVSDETEENEFIIEETEETIYPIQFGPNDDGTVSFITNKFELKFLEGEDLPEDYYIVQFGDGPDDGGEDFEEEESDELPQIQILAA